MEDLLALVRAFGGRIESRLRIHKSAYLLKLLGAREFERTPFRYHLYGPYSRELSGSLQQAVAGEFLEEERAEVLPFDDLTRYSYQLTDAGERWLEGPATDVEQRFGDKIPILREANLKLLELSATIAFLERDERMNREEAIRRALRLKPDCRSWERDAEKLLHDLGIPPFVRGTNSQA